MFLIFILNTILWGVFRVIGLSPQKIILFWCSVRLGPEQKLLKMTPRINLETLAIQKKITQDGKDWLTAALDPFHDFNLHLAGYPDLNASRSFVERNVQSFDITKPAGAVTWDCLVWIQPIGSFSNQQCTANTAANSNQLGYDSTDTTNLQELGLLNVSKADSGTNLFPVSAAFTAANGETAAYPCYQSSRCSRVIAGGFEVVNSTPVINKGGMVCGGSINAVRGDYDLTYVDSGLAIPTQTVSSKFQQAPPKNIAQAKTYPGSRSWEAKEGIYVPMRMTTEANEPTVGIAGGINVISATGSLRSVPIGATAFNQVYASLPYELGYAYFTGLSAETTLSVTYVTHIESYPTLDDSLVRNITPSAVYDPKALMLYGQMVARMDLCVPQTDNPSGEFWRSLMSKLPAALNAMTPVAAGINPYAGLAVSGSAQLASLVQKYMNQYSQQRTFKQVPGHNNASVGNPIKGKGKKKSKKRP